MSFKLEINGTQYENFIAGSAFKTIEALSGKFSVTATVKRGDNYPIKRGDTCRILINDESIINGFVEMISISGSSSDHKILIQGRDKTSDIIESSLSGNPEFSAPITLQRVIQNILASGNINNVEVIQNAAIKPFGPGDQVSGGVGENMWDFINKYCVKRQVLANSDGDGNLVIFRVGDVFSSAQIIHEENNPRSNVKTYSFTDDDTRRFNTYIVKSQANPVALDLSNSGATAADIVNNSGSVVDTDIRESKQMTIDSTTSDNSLTAGQTAAWEANVRRAKGFTYSCTVQGFLADPKLGIIWRANRLHSVKDEFANLDAIMLLKSTRFNIDIDGGSTTDLEFTYRDAYSLEVLRDALEVRTTKTGGSFVN